MTDFLLLSGLVRFSSSTGAVSTPFGGEIARGKHLFPFRTEPLSLSAPMVLGGQPPGRVGRRRSYSKEPPGGRLFLCPHVTGPPRSDRLERSGGQSAGSFYAAIRSGTPARSCSGCGAPEARPDGRLSQSRTGSGSIPYSPSVAKSIIRSAASSSRSLMSISGPVMGSKLWMASDGTRHLQAKLQSGAHGC